MRLRSVLWVLAAACAAVLLPGGALPSSAAAGGYAAAQVFLEDTYDSITKMLDAPGEGGASLAGIVGEAFDLEYFSSRILTERWTDLDGTEQEKFLDSLALSLGERIVGALREAGGGSIPALTLEPAPFSGRLPSGDEAALYLRREKDLSWKRGGLESRTTDTILLRGSLAGSSAPMPLIFALGRHPDGSWKITDIFSSGKGLVHQYRVQARELLKQYSLPYLNAELSGRGYVVLEDWSAGGLGNSPPGWRWRKGDDGKRMPYALREEGGARYLEAKDRGESIALGKDVRWDVKKYPYLSFSWRARHLPEGGDERAGETNDSAAGVAVIFRLRLGLLPISVKYVWSASLPVGAGVQRGGFSRPWVIAADSGDGHLGEWRSHVFNVYEAYRRTFGGDPPDGTVGLWILTDADSVGILSSADYGTILALKEADTGTGIDRIVDPR